MSDVTTNSAGHSYIDASQFNKILSLYDPHFSEFLEEILYPFQNLFSETLSELKRSIREGSYEKSSKLAHRIKGCAKTLGAASIVSACEKIESSCNSKDLRDIDIHIETLSTEYSKTAAEFSEILCQNGCQVKLSQRL